MNNFKALYRSGRVKRYHTTDVAPQTVAHHSWGVAMVVWNIYPRGEGYTGVPSQLLMAALTHDLAESVTGDVPYTAKVNIPGSPRLNRVLKEMEHSFNVDNQIVFKLSEAEHRILKWADMFELCAYCLYQVNMGNEYAIEILNNGLSFLREKGFPTTEAKELYESVFS